MRPIYMYLQTATSPNRFTIISIVIGTFLIPLFFELIDIWGILQHVSVNAIVTLILLWVVGKSSSVDETKMEKKLKRVTSDFSGQINELREDHGRMIARTQTHMRDLQNWLWHIDKALREQVDLELPSPGFSAEGVRWNFETATPDVTLTQKPLRRFRAWFRYWILAKDD